MFLVVQATMLNTLQATMLPPHRSPLACVAAAPVAPGFSGCLGYCPGSRCRSDIQNGCILIVKHVMFSHTRHVVE